MTVNSRPLRIGAVGAGMISRYHLEAWAKLRDAKVVAICDVDAERAAQRAREFAIPATPPDLGTMLARERLDAVDIVTPPATHAALVEMAADAGVPVICQKPLMPRLAEAEAVIARVGERVRFMIHENWRFRPHYRQAKAWIDEGRLGRIVQGRLSTRSSGMIRTGADLPFALRRQPFMAGLERLFIAESLIHHIDVMRWLAGPLRVVAARTQRLSDDVIGETTATILFDGPDGASLVVDGNCAAPDAPERSRDYLELIGTRGTIRFEGDVLSLAGRHAAARRTDIDATYQASFDAVIAHFVACLRSGAPFETDRLENIETLRLVEAAYEAAAR